MSAGFALSGCFEIILPRTDPVSRLDRDRAAASDETLLAWVAAGDRLAFDEVTLRHLPRVHTLVLRIVRNSALAEETTQDVMVRAWQNAARFDPGRARFTTWLHVIAVNLAINRARAPVATPLEEVGDLTDPKAGPEECLARKERDHRMQQAMDALPPRQRAAIALFYDQDLDGVSAAAALSVSVRGLEGLLRRARRFLAARLREGEDT